MTVPLLRVCYHCGYPTPGRHASSCRDAGSGVVEVAKHTAPIEVAALRAQVASLTNERDRLRGQLAEREEYLKVVSDQSRDLFLGCARKAAERDAAQALLVEEQRDHAATREALARAQRDRDALRPVVEAAVVFVTEDDPTSAQIEALADAVDVMPWSAFRPAVDALPSPTPGSEDHPSGTSAAPGEVD